VNHDLEAFESVICHISSTEKSDAINEVIDTCSVFQTLPDIQKFKHAVIRREEIETTGIGHGIAIAHGKVRNLQHIHVGLGLSECGVVFNAKDGKPVHFLFVIASSPTRQFEYIRTLSVLLRTVRDPEVREELLSGSGQADCQDNFSADSHTLIRMLATQHFSWLWLPQEDGS
jgi:PTS system nitrogen regulatory IIA component